MPQRKNSIGYDVENEITKLNIEKIFSSLEVNFNACPIISGKNMLDTKHKVFNPSDLSQCIGEVAFSSQSTIEQSIDTASLYFPVWKNCFQIVNMGLIGKYFLHQQNRMVEKRCDYEVF